MSDTLMSNVAPIATTDTNSLTFYTKNSNALSGTIYTLIVSEVA